MNATTNFPYMMVGNVSQWFVTNSNLINYAIDLTINVDTNDVQLKENRTLAYTFIGSIAAFLLC